MQVGKLHYLFNLMNIVISYWFNESFCFFGSERQWILRFFTSWWKLFHSLHTCLSNPGPIGYVFTTMFITLFSAVKCYRGSVYRSSGSGSLNTCMGRLHSRWLNKKIWVDREKVCGVTHLQSFAAFEYCFWFELNVFYPLYDGKRQYLLVHTAHTHWHEPHVRLYRGASMDEIMTILPICKTMNFK